MNRPGRRLPGAALCLALVATSAPAAPEATLPGADVASLLDLARRQNPELAALRHEAAAAAERVDTAAALADPTLRIELENVGNAGSGAAPNLLPGRVGETKYTFIQPLPFWGKRALRRDASAAEAAQADGQVRLGWADLAMRIKIAHAQSYRTQREIALMHELIGIASTMERIARARYAIGLAPQQDVLRAQIERTALLGELLELEAERHHRHVRLNTLLRRPTDAPLAEPLPPRPLPAAEKLDRLALTQRMADSPLFAIAQAEIEAAGKKRALSEKDRYPDFSLGIAPTQVGSRISAWSVMLEMNIPLQQDSRRAREREAEAALDAALARSEATRDRLLGDLAEALAGLDAARNIARLIETALQPQAETGLRAALAAYENGKTDFAALLDAQRQLLKARRDRLRAESEAQSRRAEIERLLGEDL